MVAFLSVAIPIFLASLPLLGAILKQLRLVQMAKAEDLVDVAVQKAVSAVESWAANEVKAGRPKPTPEEKLGKAVAITKSVTGGGVSDEAAVVRIEAELHDRGRFQGRFK